MNETLTIGLAIQVARENLGLSMRQLADSAGLSVSSISMIEGGLRDPNLSTVVAVSRALGITPADLLQSAKKLSEELPTIERNRAELKMKKDEILKLNKSLAATLAELTKPYLSHS